MISDNFTINVCTKRIYHTDEKKKFSSKNFEIGIKDDTSRIDVGMFYKYLMKKFDEVYENE